MIVADMDVDFLHGWCSKGAVSAFILLVVIAMVVDPVAIEVSSSDKPPPACAAGEGLLIGGAAR